MGIDLLYTGSPLVSTGLKRSGGHLPMTWTLSRCSSWADRTLQQFDRALVEGQWQIVQAVY